MPDFPFADSLQSLPQPFDTDAASRAWEEWRCLSIDNPLQDNAVTMDAIEAAAEDKSAPAVLTALFGNSPYLTAQALREPSFVCELLAKGPDEVFSSILSEITGKGKESLNDNGIDRQIPRSTIDSLGRGLRIAKRRAALTIAIADITHTWPLERVTQALSEFAEKALNVAAAYLLREAAASGAFELPNPDAPLEGSGLIIIGMGKLGAGELNYSSDIDLIILYDTERIKTDAPDRLQNNFVRLTRNLIKLIDERTPEGYVFRTDLRLRPDPGATPLALSRLAAETYYESLGQNWERAAMIKARAIAGDIEAGEAFLKHLVPFVWRKNLDFAAIQDIHSIKRQINAHKGGTSIGTKGHNIKLGQGGIREIEFFAQTQQLIWGGREPQLRSPYTVQTLADLADFGQCGTDVADDLTAAYGFLRRVEHRLQMINDEQSQTLPTTDEAYNRLAVFLGYDDGEAFSRDLLTHLHCVRDHYADLFADAPGLDSEDGGNLVFTGSDVDPETLDTIRNLGFRTPERADNLIRAWHHGRYRATQSTRAREILTELLPRILNALSATADPDAALLRFDTFLQGLPAGVQLFSMFHANPELLDLIAEIIGIAPRLARHMSNHPAVLDSVLAEDFFGSLPDLPDMQNELTAVLALEEYFEAKLDAARRWSHDRRFQIGVQRLRGTIDAAAASTALSHIAETVIGCLFTPVSGVFEDHHGEVANGEMAVVALGKLGSREMTASSDLDLVFIYAIPEDAAPSDGAKPLAPTQYYTRLGQRLINAITAPTAEGSLYEVDMRLRPSGNAGPVATPLDGFRRYHAEEAWTWEHMALTRARVVFATSGGLWRLVSDEITSALARVRKKDKLLRDVADMRQRLARDKPASSHWSLKMMRGGMVDIEFVVQYLLLLHANDDPALLEPAQPEATGVMGAIERLMAAGHLNDRDGKAMSEALKLWHALQGMLSLTVEDDITPERAAELPRALKQRLTRIGGCEDFDVLEATINETANKIYGIFQRLIEEPAATLVNDESPSDEEQRPLPPV